MKRYLTIILFSSFIMISYAQEYDAQEQFDAKFEYEMIINFGTPKVLKSELYYSQNHAFFLYYEQCKSETENESEEYSDSNGNLGFQIRYKDTTKYFVYTADDKMISLAMLLKKSKQNTVVVENIPHIDWDVTNENKKIGKYTCTKAIGKYRGREYTAWFSPEIPVNKGPYKFHGLYGLIFEIYDSTREVSFKLLNISFKKYQIMIPDFSKYKKISMQEYLDANKNYLKNIMSKIAAKTDRKFSVEISTSFKSIEME